MADKGFLVPFLHFHLPFVRHPEHEYFLEENWYFEAVLESYVPLLRLLATLPRKMPHARVCASISPPLLWMMHDPLLGQRLVRYLRDTIGLAAIDAGGAHRANARDYISRAEGALEFCSMAGGMPAAIRALGDNPCVELATTCLSHAYLPNLAPSPALQSLQIGLGLSEFEGYAGVRPGTFWLPECGYAPGMDERLAALGVRNVFLEAHAAAQVHGGRHSAAPIETPGGIMALVRDPVCSANVWSATNGYPAAPEYRDFYLDAGRDIALPHMRAHGLKYGCPSGVPAGLKYYSISRRPYDAEAASRMALRHADHFVEMLRGRVRDAEGRLVFAAPYDAELFGHWWHEGVQWLEAVIGLIGSCGDIEMKTPSEVAAAVEPVRGEPGLSSWGEGGFSSVWSEDDEYLRRVLSMARGLEDMARLDGRLVEQALRESAMFMASDWAFLIRKGTSLEYARARLVEHEANFSWIEGNIGRGFDVQRLAALEERTTFMPGHAAWDYWKSLV